MFVFRKIWHALFSCNTRFEICPYRMTTTRRIKMEPYARNPTKYFICSKSTKETL